MSAGVFSIMILAFTAVSSSVAGIALAVRDVSARRARVVRRLGLNDEEEIALLPPRPRAGVDRWFALLIEGTGLGISASAALALVAAGGLIGCAAPLLLADTLLGAGIGLVLGAGLPLGIFMWARARRLAKLQKLLPEGLEIVADSVRAGHSIEQACNEVAIDLKGPISQEFGRCVHQLKLGHTLPAVLEQLVDRAPLVELRIFSTAVMVHRQTGGNLALLTERLAHASRDRQGLRDHLSAVTSGSRFSAVGLILASIFGVAALSYIQPAYQRTLWTHPMGPTLLATAVGLQVIGLIWLWRVMRVRS
ncbi:MAG: type II secretion system F family protein [Pirellulales bacterium]